MQADSYGTSEEDEGEHIENEVNQYNKSYILKCQKHEYNV